MLKTGGKRILVSVREKESRNKWKRGEEKGEDEDRGLEKMREGKGAKKRGREREREGRRNAATMERDQGSMLMIEIQEGVANDGGRLGRKAAIEGDWGRKG